MWFEWTYSYDANGEMDDERSYEEYCEVCWNKNTTTQYREDQDAYICDDCLEK